jgi:hydrophobic/amphiphilic exporter-1 (mainly G- bacteria), HAE1 family
VKITQIAVDRPITTSMLVGIVIVVSFVSLTRLPIDLMPDVTFPSLSISVNYPGATPEEIEQLVTRPIEEAMGSVSDVEEMETESSEDSASIRLRFAWGTNIDEAANEVRQRLDRMRRSLPEEVEPPVLYKFDVNQRSIIRFGLFSDSMTLPDLRYLAEHSLKPRLERISGVASVNVGGSRLREIQVDLSAPKLEAFELAPQTIVQAIRSENINLPAGEVFTGDTQLVMRTQGQFVAPSELANIVVAQREGIPIYLRDVAEIRDGFEELREIERIDGQPGIRMYLYKQSGSNTVTVAEAAKAEIERIRRDYPHVSVIVLSDSSTFIRDAIDNVQSAALFGSLLAVVILLLFLRNLRSTLIIATSIPISVMAAFSLIYFADFTLNIVSFGGLALGVGLLVDSSIVVLENIFRHRENGQDSRTAAIEGTREVSTAIIASTLTTLVVFLPLLFLSGSASVMFTQLAYVVAFSLMCSLIVSLTLIPTLARRLLRVESLEAEPNETLLHKLYRVSETWLNRLETSYKNVACLLFAAVLPLRHALTFEYMPETDEGEVDISGRMAPGTRLESMDAVFTEFERIAMEVAGDETAHITTRFGMSSWFRATGSNTGRIELMLKPVEERTRSSTEIANALRPHLEDIPGVRASARAGGGLFLFRMLQPDGGRLSVEVRGYDREVGQRLAEEVRDTLNTIPGITGAQLSRSEGRPEIGLQIDRYKAAEAGFTVSSIADAIRTSFGGQVATRYREGGDEFNVRVRLQEDDRMSIKDLRTAWITAPSGERVPVSNFLKESRSIGPTEISRKNQERYVTVSADLEPEYALGNVMVEVEKRLSAIQMPEGFTLDYGGEYEDQQESYAQLMMGLLLALLLVYMVMAAQFESFIQPFVIMFSIPFASIGVLLILWLTGTSVNVQSFLGIIVLVGIVVNNAIVLVDYTNLLRREQGIELREAIELSGRRRLRPILMTTLTTVLALVPMALGFGSGGELQAPMARVVIGGLLTSTLVTLLLVPVVYVTVEEGIARLRRRSTDVSDRNTSADTQYAK